MCSFVLLLLCIFYLLTKGSAYSKFGELCANNDECNDHRLKCNGTEENLGVCICDRYYKLLNGTECVQIYDISFIMDVEVNNIDRKDLETLINDYNEEIFGVQLMAGLFVAVVCALTVFLVMIYCCFVRISDRALKSSVKAAVSSRREAPRVA